MEKFLKKHFYFVRHAETDWNNRKLCQGQKDIPLSEKGSEEVKVFAGETTKLDIGCLVSSPLSRALETAKAIHHVHPDAGLYTVAELSERSWGELEGISSEEMYAIERQEEEDRAYFPGKGVEPRMNFRQRVSKGISIAQTYHPHPLIVSHGRVFRELCHLLGIPPLRQIPNCQLVKLSFGSNGWESQVIKQSI